MRKLYLATAVSVVLMIGFHQPQTGSKNFSVQQFMMLSQEEIAFMGDVLFVKRQPWFEDGNAEV